MLKLLKYEWKACARICLPLYGVVLLMSVINVLMATDQAQQFMNGIPSVTLAMLYVALLMAVFVVTVVILIQRFYKNLLSDEGYLMFTLPVTVAQHIWSKVIIAVAFSLLSSLVAVLSIAIIGAETDLLRGIAQLVEGLIRAIQQNPHALGYLLEGILLVLLSAASGALYLYLCMALGHLATKHRVLMAVVWYFVLSTAAQFLGTTLLVGMGSLPLDWLYDAVRYFFFGIGEAAAVHVVMLALCVLTAIPGAICYFGTHYILKHRLNLD